ncbi:MAG: MerR family transcriptional regulator [Microthrixaceae bacterium]
MTAAAQNDSHLAIGEVLSLIQEEFPDVTISKIRFLESQGLIAPERTSSGFRKFYDADIQRLRWILQQQTNHFLPLKVIKKMLEEGLDSAPGAAFSPAGTQPTLWATSEASPGEGGASGSSSVAGPDGASENGTASSTDARSSTDSASGATVNGATDSANTVDLSDSADNSGSTERPPRSPNHPSVVAAAMAQAAARPRDDREPVEASTAGSQTSERLEDTGGIIAPSAASGPPSAPQRTFTTPADIVAALQEDPRPAAERRSRPVAGPGDLGSLTRTPSFGANDLFKGEGDKEFLSADEVCQLFDVEVSLLSELEKFGLLSPRKFGGTVSYGEADMEIIGMAVKYMTLGVEARHLRMYKIAAEREAGFIEQLVVPLLKRKNPTARDDAAKRASDLATMGDELHSLILRQKLRDLFGHR